MESTQRNRVASMLAERILNDLTIRLIAQAPDR
jgi:hypothetical protein